MMVGSCPCKVSSESHINGRRVSEPVREDKGKTMASELEDRRDPKRARVVLSKGREVVSLSYLRVIGVAIMVMIKRQRELAEKKEEEERDYWFNILWPMTKLKQTWWEKQLAKEKACSSGDSSGEEASKVTPARGKDKPESGDRNLESGNYNPESGNCHPK
jgi:hypothetical protein